MDEEPENSIVAQRVNLARSGNNPYLVSRLESGWLVMADRQMVVGHCIILADPVVTSLNDLDGLARQTFLADMGLVGDAMLSCSDAYRINYEIMGNTDPALHAHIIPRYKSEHDAKRAMPVWFYDWHEAPAFDPQQHGEFQQALQAQIARMR